LAKPVRKSKGKEVTPISEGAKLVDQYFDHVGEAFLRHAPEINPENCGIGAPNCLVSPA